MRPLVEDLRKASSADDDLYACAAERIAALEAALEEAEEGLLAANSCADGYYIPAGKMLLPDVEKALAAIKKVKP